MLIATRDRLPTESEGRVLIFSPIYPIGDPMRWRIVDWQFVRIMSEATHWVSINTLEMGE